MVDFPLRARNELVAPPKYLWRTYIQYTLAYVHIVKKGLGLHIVIVIYAVASGHNVLKRPRLLAINTWGVSVCKMTKLLFKDNQAYRRRRDSTLAPHCGGGRLQQLPQKKGFARVTLLNIVDSIHIQLVPCCWLLTFGRLWYVHT